MVFTRIPPNGAMGGGPRVARGGREPDGLRAHRAACAPERPVPRRLVGRECRQDPRRGPEGDHGRGRTATGINAGAATVATSLGTLPTSRKRKALWPSKYSATPPHMATVGIGPSGSPTWARVFLMPSATTTMPAAIGRCKNHTTKLIHRSV